MMKEELCKNKINKQYFDNLKISLYIIILIIVDQISKYFVLLNLKGHKPYSLLKNIFELNYLENRSAAFGIDPITFLHKIFNFKYFNEHPNAFVTAKFIFFVIFTIVVVSLVLYIVFKMTASNFKYKFFRFSLLLIASGAVGNFIDRVFRKYVIDFLYFKLINFPIFNIADIYITIGAILMCYIIIFVFDENDLNTLMSNIKQKKTNKNDK
ncbi:signal peptidase II [Lachnobacterium bovis]|uniref:Lipoprotein signal peptidase n=2 Tax=Lachnobacterium bovis TaxID=140626 RepID=A0A1H9PXW3_9FIRM|nr:signal peptidase II [Lachnobacterium bovis]SER53136.1 signal peptidase II [Lachnobacterium bovis]